MKKFSVIFFRRKFITFFAVIDKKAQTSSDFYTNKKKRSVRVTFIISNSIDKTSYLSVIYSMLSLIITINYICEYECVCVCVCKRKYLLRPGLSNTRCGGTWTRTNVWQVLPSPEPSRGDATQDQLVFCLRLDPFHLDSPWVVSSWTIACDQSSKQLGLGMTNNLQRRTQRLHQNHQQGTMKSRTMLSKLGKEQRNHTMNPRHQFARWMEVHLRICFVQP